MYSPHIDKAEAIRLINHIGMCDVWILLTGNLTTSEIDIHAEDREKGNALLAALVLSDENFRTYLFNTLKEYGYEIRKP